MRRVTAKGKILKLLQSDEMSTSEIASATNRSYWDTINLLKALLSEHRVSKKVRGKAAYWKEVKK